MVDGPAPPSATQTLVDPISCENWRGHSSAAPDSAPVGGASLASSMATSHILSGPGLSHLAARVRTLTRERKEALNQSDIERRCVVRLNKQLQAAQSAIASARAPPPHSPSCSEILALLRSGAFWNNLDGIKCVGSMEQFSYLLFYQRNNRRSQIKKGIKKKPVSCASSAVQTSCFLLASSSLFFMTNKLPLSRH